MIMIFNSSTSLQYALNLFKIFHIYLRVGEKRQHQWSQSFSCMGHPYKPNEWCLSSDRLNWARGHPLQVLSFDQWEGFMFRSWLHIGQNLKLVSEGCPP